VDVDVGLLLIEVVAPVHLAADHRVHRRSVGLRAEQPAPLHRGHLAEGSQGGRDAFGAERRDGRLDPDEVPDVLLGSEEHVPRSHRAALAQRPCRDDLARVEQRLVEQVGLGADRVPLGVRRRRPCTPSADRRPRRSRHPPPARARRARSRRGRNDLARCRTASASASRLELAHAVVSERSRGSTSARSARAAISTYRRRISRTGCLSTRLTSSSCVW